MDTSIRFPTNTDPKEPRRKVIAFERRDWLNLLAILICAAAYAFLHRSIFSSDYKGLPGIGLTLSCWTMLFISMCSIGWKKLQWTKQNIFLLVSTLLLSGSYAVFANGALRLMNLPVLMLLCIMTVYALKGSVRVISASGFENSLFCVFHSLHIYLFAPFHALFSLDKLGKNRRLKEMILGFCICIPVIGLLLLLLCDADSVFSDVIGQIGNIYNTIDLGLLPWNIIRMLALTLILFSCLYGLNHTSERVHKARKRRSLAAITMCTLLTAISLLYVLFVYVQIHFLFAGKTLAGGDYADYARSGFFQLVIVGIITLLIVLTTLCKFPQNSILRFESGLITLLTMVIVYSAFKRMQLYIQKYGFTLLRAVTLWGMLVIAAAMIAALIKALRINTPIFAPLLIFTICTWLLFNYSNVNARIAEYNISAYQSGEIEELDIYYLQTLGIDALKPMKDLLQQNVHPVELQMELSSACRRIIHDKPSAYDWCLNWSKLD